MSAPKRNIRGLQDIQTLSGRVDQVFHPYKAYMRVTCLEMEKARRGEEKESAMHRVKSIDARLREIEAEEAALLETISESNTGEAVDAPGGAGVPHQPRPSTSGFNLRY